MKFDARAVFAALALVLASCQGAGLDSGRAWRDMTPPVSQPGSMNGGMAVGGLQRWHDGSQMAGPNVGANGQEELTNPGATLAPNEAQYPIGQGPTGMKCPAVQQFNQHVHLYARVQHADAVARAQRARRARGADREPDADAPA